METLKKVTVIHTHESAKSMRLKRDQSLEKIRDLRFPKTVDKEARVERVRASWPIHESITEIDSHIRLAGEDEGSAVKTPEKKLGRRFPFAGVIFRHHRN